MKMSARVNLNTYVAVILTDFGASKLNSYHSQFNLPSKYKREPAYKGQQVRYPLWELMNIFGPCLTMGFHSIPFENNEIEFLR